ncbi:MAG: 30S ribosomal protein S4 [bacterium]
MARYRGPSCRICRAKAEKLFLKGKRCLSEKCGFNKRSYPPGSQGPNFKKRKISDYGEQLAEKQKAKYIYGILERQFKNYFKKAKALSGLCGDNLLIMLERRLDNVIYRAGWVESRKEARQMVSHNHLKVGGRKINIPSYLVKVAETIELDREPRLTAVNLPPWLKVEGKKIEVLRFPERKEIATPIEENKIVAFYSK